jgi:hypothetical protein
MSSELRRPVSLALNLILAVTVVVLALHKLNRASAASAIGVSQGKTTNEVSQEKMANETPVFTKQPKLARYADFKSASDRRRWLVDQLRAMGVPNDVLALVAGQDLEAQWDSRFEKCRGKMDKMAALQLEKDTSKDAEMRAALGEEGFKEWDQKNMLWEAMSTAVEVNASEADAIYDLKKKLQQSQFDVEQATLLGTMDEADANDALKEAYSEFNQQMKAVLGDERYAKSQQTDDAFVADNLRAQLATANPSDSQFQELFQAEKEWNNSLSELDPSSPDYAAQLKALNDARDQEYQRVLGTNVFNTLQEQQDPGYSQMKKFETLWGLDDNKIDYVYGNMKQYQNSVADYKAQVLALQAQGQSVDWDAVNQNLQQLAGETQQALQNYLGQDSFNKLMRNHVYKFTLVQPPQ